MNFKLLWDSSLMYIVLQLYIFGQSGCHFYWSIDLIGEQLVDQGCTPRIEFNWIIESFVVHVNTSWFIHICLKECLMSCVSELASVTSKQVDVCIDNITKITWSAQFIFIFPPQLHFFYISNYIISALRIIAYRNTTYKQNIDK